MRIGRSIRARLLAYMTLFLVAINICFWLFYFVARKYLDHDLGVKLRGVAEITASGIRAEYLKTLRKGDEGSRTYRNIRRKLVHSKESFQLNSIMIVDPNRRLVIDAGGTMRIGDPVFMLEVASDEMKKALSGASIASTVYRGEDSRLYKSGYAPVKDRNGKVSYVLVAEASAAFLGELETFRALIMIITVFSVVAVIVLGLFLSRFVADPIRRLVNASYELKQGRYRRVESKSDGEIGYLINAFNEMADSIKQKEKRLEELYRKESERAEKITLYAETILSSIATGIISIDSGGIVRVCNPEACKIFGLKEKEMIGLHYREVPCLKPFEKILDKALISGGIVKERNIDYINPAGRRFHLGLSCSASREATSTGIAANMVLTDHTPLVKLQDEIKRKETLAAIGELAAHVAHEVRNPLSSMKIYMDLLSRDNVGHDKKKEFIEKISSEISRLENIVTEFLQFSTPSRINLSQFKLVDVIRDAVLFAGKETGLSNVKIEGNYDEHCDLVVMADKNQMMQMFLNLIINSTDAMVQGGTIKIDISEGGPKPVDSNPEEGSPAGKSIKITLKDSGCGMDEEIMAKATVPFFTTKSHGTGLGLSLVQRVVENHRGKMDIRSSLGDGTRVDLILPIGL